MVKRRKGGHDPYRNKNDAEASLARIKETAKTLAKCSRDAATVSPCQHGALIGSEVCL